MKEPLPLARETRLIIKELDDEVLIYDLDTDKAHCLNRMAARIWKNCDGSRTVATLRELIEEETNSPVPEEVVWLALDKLEKLKLLEQRVDGPRHLSRMSRRQMVRLVGSTAIALPIITSIVAPVPVAAASCSAATNRNPGCPCTGNNQCSSACCQNFVCTAGGSNCQG